MNDDFPNELLWPGDHRRFRGSTAEEMDEEMRELQRDPLRLRSQAAELEEEVEKFLGRREDLFEEEERGWLRKLFRKNTERSKQR
jgi:hypothetical protein